MTISQHTASITLIDQTFDALRTTGGDARSLLRWVETRLTGHDIAITITSRDLLGFDPERPVTVTITQPDPEDT